MLFPDATIASSSSRRRSADLSHPSADLDVRRSRGIATPVDAVARPRRRRGFPHGRLDGVVGPLPLTPPRASAPRVHHCREVYSPRPRSASSGAWVVANVPDRPGRFHRAPRSPRRGGRGQLVARRPSHASRTVQRSTSTDASQFPIRPAGAGRRTADGGRIFRPSTPTPASDRAGCANRGVYLPASSTSTRRGPAGAASQDQSKQASRILTWEKS